MNGELLDEGIVQFRYKAITWKIPNFFELPKEPGYVLQSTPFRVASNLYCLRLYPNGTKTDEKYMNFLLRRLPSPGPEIVPSYEIGCKLSKGGENRFLSVNWSGESVAGQLFFMVRSDFHKNKDHYVLDGILTLYCRIRMSSELSVVPLHGEQKQEESAALVGPRITLSHIFKARYRRSASDGARTKPISFSGVDKLQSDFRRILLKGVESDACLVVCGKEFQVHRNVLRARSPVFEAMFHHDTAEKASRRVVIDDLKPEIFQDFLEYLYTGRVEAFSDDNAFGLYAAAKKYDVPTLKTECVEYMSRSLSIDSICDVINIALCHHEQDLMDLAMEFFKNNLTSILLTVKWQRLLSENSTRGKELLIKALVPGKESKQSTSTVECSSTKE